MTRSNSPSPLIREGWGEGTLSEGWRPMLFIRPMKNGRNVPRKSRLVGGDEGHNINETSSSGSPALWAESFTFLGRLCYDVG